MPTDLDTRTGPAPRGLIRGPQNFVSGVFLVVLALFAIWLVRDLSQGTLRAMGPAMLPRWLAIGVGTCGLALAVSAVFMSGDPLRLSDYSALVAFAILLSIAAIAGKVIDVAFYGGTQGSNVFFYTVLVLFYGTILLMFISTLKSNTWLEERGLRGAFFVV